MLEVNERPGEWTPALGMRPPEGWVARVQLSYDGLVLFYARPSSLIHSLHIGWEGHLGGGGWEDTIQSQALADQRPLEDVEQIDQAIRLLKAFVGIANIPRHFAQGS